MMAKNSMVMVGVGALERGFRPAPHTQSLSLSMHMEEGNLSPKTVMLEEEPLAALWNAEQLDFVSVSEATTE